ncbi:MAG: glutamine--fructose-6-phosphate transaminase (isomerizing), partial [Candidatus Omnitrophica bacterium]|nr:glutamine--fructose-6-phosphate transaminase (isomerizing) [Candidatus Omnitrophota bacterium]
MCGIVGYIGDKQAQPILLDGLKRLEYRGYDSAGIASVSKDKVSVRKQKGKIAVLEKLLKKRPLKGTIAISHTRWATHGVPSQKNAHPHTDCNERIAVVHNGIIENYEDLKERLIKEGHSFKSETDTDVIAHLIEKYYKDDLESAVRAALKLLKGSFALGIISSYHPEKLIAARVGSPLVVGLGKNENYIASDIPALLKFTKEILFIEDNEMVVLTAGLVKITDFAGKRIKRLPTKITWDISQAEKQGYPHFMLKEMYEQPSVLEGILNHRVSSKRDSIHFEELAITDKDLAKAKKISIIACGTAYHAGLTGKYILESLCGIPVEVDVSSEFRYRNPVVGADTLVIAISQSGETADTIASIREAKARGAKVLSIVNVLGSTITRESDGVIYTHAGPEVGVASTKAYTAQLCILYLLAMHLALLKTRISRQKVKGLLLEMSKLPQQADKILKDSKAIQRISKRHYNKYCFLYLGRNLNFPNALEGALKLKEISYV